MSFVCDTCPKIYKTKRGLDNHLKKGCQPKKKVVKKKRCDLCNIEFETDMDFRRHMELDICSKFLRNNTYCYTCHLEFGTNELLVQHEFTDQHLNMIRQGYSNVTPLSDVRDRLRDIFDNGTIQEDEVYAVTHEENKIQEELFEIEEALKDEEKKLLKEQDKEKRKEEREKKKQVNKDKRKKEMDKIKKKGLKMKPKKPKEEEKPSADISKFFDFAERKSVAISSDLNNVVKKSSVNIIRDDQLPEKVISNGKKNKKNKTKNNKNKKPKVEYDKDFNYEFACDSSDSEGEYTEIKVEPDKKKTKKPKDKPIIKKETPNEDDFPVPIFEPIISMDEEIKVFTIGQEEEAEIIKPEPIEKPKKEKKPRKPRAKKEVIQYKIDKCDETSTDVQPNVEMSIQKLNKNSSYTIEKVDETTLEKTKTNNEIQIEKFDETTFEKSSGKTNNDEIGNNNEIGNNDEIDINDIVIESSNMEIIPAVGYEDNNNDDYINRQIVQYNTHDREKSRKEFYKKLREKRQDEQLNPYIEQYINNYDSVHNIKNYIGKYNINSINLFQKLMSSQLPYLYNPSDADRMNNSEFDNRINNIMNQRQLDNQQWSDRQRQENVIETKVVQKTDKNTFNNDINNVMKNRDLQMNEIRHSNPPNSSLAAPNMALPQQQTDGMNASQFDKEMSKILQERNQQDKVLKQTVKEQKIVNQPMLQESSGGNFLGSLNEGDMNEYQKPNQKPQRDLCNVLGMFDKKQPTQSQQQPRQRVDNRLNIDVHLDDREDMNDLEKELKNVHHNVPRQQPQVNNDFNKNQKSALNNLLGQADESLLPQNTQPTVSNPPNQFRTNNNMNLNHINVEVNNEDFDLGNELEQVSMELEKRPQPPKPKSDPAKELQDFKKFQDRANENMKVVQAKQLDSIVKAPVWIIMQKVVNDNNMEKNMMNMLVNCRVEDYEMIHRFIVKSNQLAIETDKKKSLVKIFNKYIKFLITQKKAGKAMIQGKNVKYMLEILKKLKL